MNEMTEIILNLSFTSFAIYGIYVLTKWKKTAQKLYELCDEIHEEVNAAQMTIDPAIYGDNPTEKGGVEKCT